MSRAIWPFYDQPLAAVIQSFRAVCIMIASASVSPNPDAERSCPRSCSPTRFWIAPDQRVAFSAVKLVSDQVSEYLP